MASPDGGSINLSRLSTEEALRLSQRPSPHSGSAVRRRLQNKLVARRRCPKPEHATSVSASLPMTMPSPALTTPPPPPMHGSLNFSRLDVSEMMPTGRLALTGAGTDAAAAADEDEEEVPCSWSYMKLLKHGLDGKKHPVGERVGFWRETAEANDGDYALPWPQPCNDDDAWQRDEQARDVLRAVNRGAVFEAEQPYEEDFMGDSWCRLCGATNGSRQYTAAGYTWPQGLVHYCDEHRVLLPSAFSAALLRLTANEPRDAHGRLVVTTAEEQWERLPADVRRAEQKLYWMRHMSAMMQGLANLRFT